MSHTSFLSPSFLISLALALGVSVMLLAAVGGPVMGIIVVLPFILALGFARHQHITAIKQSMEEYRQQRIR